MNQLYPGEWCVIMVSALVEGPFPGDTVVVSGAGSVQSCHLLFKSIGGSGEEACYQEYIYKRAKHWFLEDERILDITVVFGLLKLIPP